MPRSAKIGHSAAMKILCFAGSLRQGSFNKKLVRIAHSRLLERTGIESDCIDLLDYPLPVYNQDIETSAFPENGLKLRDKVAAADALVISSPENNGAIAALTKNTIDWISRAPQNPWPGKWILLLGASPGALGAVRGLWHTRIPFEALGSIVYPEMFGLARAHEAFNEKNELKDPAQLSRLGKLLSSFVAQASKK
jgi:NAD(P)H-dependent FMN reductase